jgi:hypothetical protein
MRLFNTKVWLRFYLAEQTQGQPIRIEDSPLYLISISHFPCSENANQNSRPIVPFGERDQLSWYWQNKFSILCSPRFCKYDPAPTMTNTVCISKAKKIKLECAYRVHTVNSRLYGVWSIGLLDFFLYFRLFLRFFLFLLLLRLFLFLLFLFLIARFGRTSTRLFNDVEEDINCPESSLITVTFEWKSHLSSFLEGTLYFIST